MINISELPREPLLALQRVVELTIMMLPLGDANLHTFKNQKHPLYLELMTAAKVAQQAASRINVEVDRGAILDYLTLQDSNTLHEIRSRYEKILELIIALQMDDHFFPPDDLISFDQARLDISDKDEIREYLARARTLTHASKVLPDEHKKRIIHRIAQVESELLKDVAGFRAFMAAAYDIAGLARQFGEDVQPIADAIEKARTVTEKKVTGYYQLPEPEKPKQLPSPQD